MAISLTQIIAALEAKANATDSASSISDVLRLSIGSEAVSDGAILYDSAGALPTDSAFIGTLAAASNGTIYFYNGTAWNAVDSAETIVPPVPYSFQGSVSGYTSGGTEPAASNVIDKYSFATDGNATDVGNLTLQISTSAGQSSSVSGYTSGGTGPAGLSNTIDKFSFSTDANATDVGDLTQSKRLIGGGQSSSANGYTSAGYTTPPSATGNQNVIEKFPFAADENSADVGDLTGSKQSTAGQSSSTDGYVSGGATPAYTNVIEKFPFSTDANGTDVGDLTEAIDNPAGQSSSTHGYRSGGDNPNIAPTSNLRTVDKFSFSSDGNATNVGDITQDKGGTAGQSSTASGYNTGGWAPGSVRYNYIEKFPFSVDADATDVGDLTVSRIDAAGQQV